MKVRSIIIILSAAALVLTLWLMRKSGFFLNAPERAVKASLTEIERLDDASAAALFSDLSSEKAQGAGGGDIPEEGRQALRLFFEPFSFRILRSSVDGQKAAVEVSAVVTDAEALARNIRRSQLSEAYALKEAESSGEATQPDSVFTLMKRCLSSGSPKTSRIHETLSLSKGKDGWSIVSDDALRHLVTGNLSPCLNDPYLLGPDDVLSVYLDRFYSMTSEEWSDALDTKDIFPKSGQADGAEKAYQAAVSELYGYHIDDVRTEGDVADVTVSITSIDMNKVLSAYKDSLIEYARSSDSVTKDSQGLSDKSAALLEAAIKDHAAPRVTRITVRLKHDKSSWQIADTSGLTNALLGDIQAAAAAFDQN